MKKVHFIGIGGVGMSATAKLLRDKNIAISGSDEAVYPPVSDFLEKEHISWKAPYSKENIPEDADTIVIGKNAKLVAETNEEVKAAYESGKRILSFPEVLGELSLEKKTVVVAGGYGKSTTTAIIAHCLVESGLNPSFFIGAIPLSPSTSAKIGEGELFILEGDEYPSSNTDPRSKFLHFHPSHLIITPLAHDHVNIFPTEKEYLDTFEKLVELLPEEGVLVISNSGPLSDEFIKKIQRTIITYGLNQGDFRVANIEWGEKTSFDIIRGGAPIVRVKTTQLGEHSIDNILAAAAFLLSQNILSEEQFAKAISTFKGVRRRLDRQSDNTTIPIFEGFGSSYEKAKSAIAAMKKHFPENPLRVVFEPYTIGWRSRANVGQYADVFLGAEKVYIFNPPHDGKETELTLTEIVEKVKEGGAAVQGFNETAETLGVIDEELGENDSILFLSSGPLGGLVEKVRVLAEEKFPS